MAVYGDGQSHLMRKYLFLFAPILQLPQHDLGKFLSVAHIYNIILKGGLRDVFLKYCSTVEIYSMLCSV